MGLKHLEKIEVVLKKSKYPMSKSAIANEINMASVLISDYLSFFLRHKRIKKLKIGKIIKYEWVRK